MKITMKEIVNSMDSNEDIVHDILLLSLYDKYVQKNINNKTNQDNKTNNDILKINSAYKSISTRINNNLKDEYQNRKIINSINNLYIMLSNYISNFDKNNKIKSQKCIELITLLESLLKLPISFPEAIETCLLNEINNDTTISLNTNKIKRK